MKLTIPELAEAVDRSETFLRQHIHRNHLAVTRTGRRVYVDLDEAQRWAKERGITFRSPANVSSWINRLRDRSARITALVLKQPDGQVCNVFTLVRHRRKDGLGPWRPDPAGVWRTEQLDHGLHLCSFDAPWEICQSLVDGVLKTGILRIVDLEVQFALGPEPRHHWAYRDDRVTLEQLLRSPFARHSAQIREYWSFAKHPRQLWRNQLKAAFGASQSQLPRLGFPLHSRSDRVGNLMIAGAEDAITCDLSGPQNRSLTLSVEADDFEPGSFCGIVWASHCGDEVMRQQVEISPGEVSISLRSDVDSIGFSVFRVADGQCVDLMGQDLIMEVSLRLSAQIGPNMRLRNHKHQFKHDVNPFNQASTIRVQADRYSPELDRGVRQQRLDHLSHEREAALRAKGELVRFEPGKRNDAFAHLIAIIAADRDRNSPIYLADPYFMHSFRRPAKFPAEIKQLLDLFAATAGSPLLLLCGKCGGGGLPRWWSSAPKQIISHVRARAFTKQGEDKPAFHDRYLITPEREVLITNSISGWESDGVTFVKLPFGVYSTEAQRLWNMNLRSMTEAAWAEELS